MGTAAIGTMGTATIWTILGNPPAEDGKAPAADAPIPNGAIAAAQFFESKAAACVRRCDSSKAAAVRFLFQGSVARGFVFSGVWPVTTSVVPVLLAAARTAAVVDALALVG
jgi:hypothetical protein